MKKKDENEEEIFVVDCEIKQQILDIIVIAIIFFAAMFLGMVCINKYNGTWFLFYIITFMLIITGMGLWEHLKKKNNKKKSHK